MSKIEKVDVSNIKFPDRPKAPWNKEESLKLFKKSESDGHRKLTLKCEQCGLEYSVFTWRDEPAEKLSSRFLYCPECGSKGSSAMIQLDHEMGRIYDTHSNE